MTGVAVFLVKNGIGFGHIRRALLLAEHVGRRGELRPVVISQAHSLDLLRTAPVPVLNMPLLHRVPSAVTEDCYLEILERVLQRLGPAVVVEDTYPDPRYGALRAVAHVPRLLVLRRLDGESFDTLRVRGAFARYDEILLAQDGDDLAAEGHSGDSLAAIRHSGAVQIVGNIHHLPTPEEIAAVRARHGSPLVVVNGGAGGDQQPDGYGDRFLGACHRTAALLHTEGHPARFVIVTGPYYAGRSLAPLPNLTVHRFTPQLPALLAAADVAVIKPGNNALSEALHGAANLVLVPDASFLEGTSRRAEYVTERYGGAVAAPEQDQLEHAIRDALARPPRTRRPPAPARAIERVVDAIHAHASSPAPVVLPKRLTLILGPPAGVAPAAVTSRIPHSAVIGHGVGLLSTADTAEVIPAVLLADAPPRSALLPQALAAAGVELLLSVGSAHPAVDRWLGLDPPRPALLHATMQRIHVRAGEPLRPRRAVAAALRDAAHAAFLLDLTSLTGPDALECVDAMNQWISRQPVELVPVDCLRSSVATRLLRGGTRAP